MQGEKKSNPSPDPNPEEGMTVAAAVPSLGTVEHDKKRGGKRVSRREGDGQELLPIT
jgi:hypothetical protein